MATLNERARRRRSVRFARAHRPRTRHRSGDCARAFEGDWPDRIDPDPLRPNPPHSRATDPSARRAHAILSTKKPICASTSTSRLHSTATACASRRSTRRAMCLRTRDYYSVGGGFVVNHDEAAEDKIVPDTTPLPYPFHSGDELLKFCAWRNRQDDRAGDDGKRESLAQRSGDSIRPSNIWTAMQDARARHARERHAARRTESETACAEHVRRIARCA